MNRFWKGVIFTAEGERCVQLLQIAAQHGIRIRAVQRLQNGITARCSARHYRTLARLARNRNIRIRVQKRCGAFFKLRPVLCRRGLWVGFCFFGALIFQLQNFVWFIDCSGLSLGQTARVKHVLKQVGLFPGAVVTQPLLEESEYAVLTFGEEFSWVSINFEKGRVTVECAEENPVPEIESEEPSFLVAKASGRVLSVQVEDGTPQVVAGQQVERGQILIGTTRSRRDGTQIDRRAVGSVIAETEWHGSAQIALWDRQAVLTGASAEWYEVSFAGMRVALGKKPELQQAVQPLVRTKEQQPVLWGVPLPLTVTRYTVFFREDRQYLRSEDMAAMMARLECQRKLLEQFPDAEIYAWQETVEITDNILRLTAIAHFKADLCVRME